VAGRWRYVYRAIDQFGQVIDVFVSPYRDAAAAQRFFERAISATAVLHPARRCGWRVAEWRRFPSRRLPEVLNAINLGIADGVCGLWWRTPV
jgi:hypothetical protein